MSSPTPRPSTSLSRAQAHPLPLQLTLLSSAIGSIFLSLGIHALLTPSTALTTLFSFPAPHRATDARMVDSLIQLFGVKDVFMAVAIYAATFLGTRRLLGVLLLAAGVAAAADGVIVKRELGAGEWNHWGYGGGVLALGLYAVLGG